MIDRRGRRGGRRASRTENRTLLIVTNGAVTERTYLQEMKRRAVAAAKARGEALSIRVEFINGETGSLIRKLQSPNGDTRNYDEVWIVVDEDGVDRGTFMRECRDAAAGRQVWKGIVSRPCFEVWLIAHYEQVRRYRDQRDAQMHFKRIVPPSLGDKVLPLNFPYAAAGEAIERSHLSGESLGAVGALPPSPGTAMPHLVSRLGLA